MRYSTSSLLRGILASGACAAIALCGTLPAAAARHDRDRAPRTAAPAHAHYAAPARVHYAAPARVHYAAPARVHYAAPARVRYAAPARVHYAAPARVHYAAPARVHYAAPARVQYAAPARVHYAAPARVHYAAPARVHYAAPARVHYAAPARVHYAAPARAHYAAPARVHYAAPARVHYAAPARVHYAAPAPFVQYVRAPRVRRETVTRTVVRSPLIRAGYAARARAIPVVYHPRYIAGRIASVRRNAIVVDPPSGAPVIVRESYVSSAPELPVGTVVALPVTYVNGAYQYVPQGYPGSQYGSQYAYAPQYGYAPQYDYAYAPPMYCTGNSSSALYAALIPAVVGMLTGNSNGFNSNDVTSLAATALAGGDNCSAYIAPAAYGQPISSAPNYQYAAPASYAVPVTYAVTQAAPVYTGTAAYATPFGNCLAGDEDGDENCAAASGYTYGAYSSYTPQHVQGIVVGRSGDSLMVLGANGTPTSVYAAPALQSGYAINGPIAPGQVVDAYGYYSGSTFIATALV